MARGPSFSIARIPITIDPTFFIIVAILGLYGSSLAVLVAWVVIVTISILVHELGHAFAYRRYGAEPVIQLYGFGGLTTGIALPPMKTIVVSLAGPLSGILLLGVPALALDRTTEITDEFWSTVVGLVVFVNIFWSFVNLLPLLPLDGGHVTRAVIELATGRNADKTTHIISIAVSALLAVAAFGYGLLFAALFALFFAGTNWSALKRIGVPELAKELAAGQQKLAAGSSREAIAAGESVAAAKPPRDLLQAAHELEAWGWLSESNVSNAERALASLPANAAPSSTVRGAVALTAGRDDEGLALLTYGFVNELAGPGKLFAASQLARVAKTTELAQELLAMDEGKGAEPAALLASLLHHAGWFAEAAQVGDEVFRDGRVSRDKVAFQVACSIGRAGSAADSLGWLRAAIENGWSDGARVLSEPDLAPARAEPGFADIYRRLSPSRP